MKQIRVTHRLPVGGEIRHRREFTYETQESVLTNRASSIRIDLRSSLLALGDIKGMLSCLREAQSNAETLNDPRRISQVLSFITFSHWAAGNLDEGLEAGNQALAVAERLNESDLKILARYFLALVQAVKGDFAPCIENLGTIIEIFKGDRTYDRLGAAYPLAIPARVHIACVLAELGRFQEARGYSEEALKLATSLSNSFAIATASWGEGHLALFQGVGNNTILVLERAVALCRDLNLRATFPWNAAYLAYAYARTERTEQAFGLLQEATASEHDTGLLVRQPLTLALYGNVCLMAGQTTQAGEYATKGLQTATRQGQRAYEACNQLLWADTEAQSESPHGTLCEEAYVRALTLATQLGMRPLVAHCHLGRGLLHEKRGLKSEAKVEFSRASEMYRQMDMQFFLKQCEVALKALH